MDKERVQYLLATLMEEAAEVIHAAAKAHRFGLDHDEPGYGEGTNKDQILREVGDLLAIAGLLGIPMEEIYVARWNKLRKLEKTEKKYARQITGANLQTIPKGTEE